MLFSMLLGVLVGRPAFSLATPKMDSRVGKLGPGRGQVCQWLPNPNPLPRPDPMVWVHADDCSLSRPRQLPQDLAAQLQSYPHLTLSKPH